MASRAAPPSSISLRVRRTRVASPSVIATLSLILTVPALITLIVVAIITAIIIATVAAVVVVSPVSILAWTSSLVGVKENDVDDGWCYPELDVPSVVHSDGRRGRGPRDAVELVREGCEVTGHGERVHQLGFQLLDPRLLVQCHLVAGLVVVGLAVAARMQLPQTCY